MTRFSIAWLLTWIPSAVLAQEAIFEYGGWPGEGGPVLIAKRSDLVIHARPDLRPPAKRISYHRGWRIQIADNLVRTLKEEHLTTVGAGAIEAYCDGDELVHLTLKAGEPWTYYQYRAEGVVWARIQDRNCQVPVYTEESIFGNDLPQPEVQWWVQIKYADGSSPGWLLVDEDQVLFGPREF